jgi:hypothetical protein
MNKQSSKNERRPIVVTTIAIIDILLGLVMIFMTFVIVKGFINFYNNPELASKTFQELGTSYSSMTFFAIEIFILMILLFVFATGLLKNKNWAIIGRISLSILLAIYYLYNLMAGNTSSNGNLLLYYDLIVIIGLGWIWFKKK